jgi:hypothetical protein
MNMQIQVYSSGNMGDDAYQITNKVAENIQKRIEERVNAGFDKKRISYSAKEDLFPFVPAKHEAENKRLVLIFYFD